MILFRRSRQFGIEAYEVLIQSTDRLSTLLPMKFKPNMPFPEEGNDVILSLGVTVACGKLDVRMQSWSMYRRTYHAHVHVPCENNGQPYLAQ